MREAVMCPPIYITDDEKMKKRFNHESFPMMPMMMRSKKRLKKKKAIMGPFSLLQNMAMMKDENEWRGVGNHEYLFTLQMKTMMRKRKGEGEEQYLLQQPVSSGSGPYTVHQGVTMRCRISFADQ
jgi:hypothetical protein